MSVVYNRKAILSKNYSRFCGCTSNTSKDFRRH